MVRAMSRPPSSLVPVLPSRVVRPHVSPFPIRVLSLPARTLSLALLQSILPYHRWRLFQLIILLSPTPIPIFQFFRSLFRPLVVSWTYGLCTRLLAPAHARSLRFWKRVVPIYLGYKKTQASVAIRSLNETDRGKVWAKRHEWGAEKVSYILRRVQNAYLQKCKVLLLTNVSSIIFDAQAKVYNLCVELRGFYLKDGMFKHLLVVHALCTRAQVN